MFPAWGRLVYRKRVPLLVLCVVFLALAVLALVRGGHLTTGTIQGIESAEGEALARKALGKHAGPSFVAVFSSSTLTFDDADFYAAMSDALAPLDGDPRVASVLSPIEAPGPIGAKLISVDRHKALAVVVLKGDLFTAADAYPVVRAEMKPGPLTMAFTGELPYRHDLDSTLKSDLLLAELVSLPLALVVLLLVFRSLAAATLPVAVGALSVLGGIACIMLLSGVTDMPVYTLNVASLIGLGVAIDYSLFFVSRFREELAAGKTTEDAVVTSMDTTGRAIAFSGVAVGIGLGGLLFFPRSYLSAMGIAGAFVVAFAVVFALTFLPALLGVLGPRVDKGSLRKIRVRDEGDPDFWRRLAPWVMRRPVMVLVPTLLLLLALGVPFLRLHMSAANVSVLPMKTESRATYEVLRADFAAEGKNRIDVVVHFPDERLTEARVAALFELRDRLAALPDVTGVESVLDFNPTLDRAQAAKMLAVPESDRPIDVATAIEYTTGDGVTVLSVLTADGSRSGGARELVRAIRKERRVGDGTLLVTGASATDVDSTDFLLGHAPHAIGFVMGLTYLVLLYLFRSAILPLKAVLMNLLSIAGSFGALVWVFQDGHLSSVLRFEPGPIEPTLPVLLFCVVFGLSMDYEVLLLSRMKEEYDKHHDNTRAVTEGLAQSGRLITSAAAIMVAVFAAFALASVVIVKAMGVGMTMAVALDATLVRLLIVPATMRLFGDLNWWPGGRRKRA